MASFQVQHVQQAQQAQHGQPQPQPMQPIVQIPKQIQLLGAKVAGHSEIRLAADARKAKAPGAWCAV